MIFDELVEFGRDKKRLAKRYRSIDDDLRIVRQVLTVFPNERPPFSFQIGNLGIDTCVIKVKKIACRSIPGKGVNTGFRLVYAHFKEDCRITFIELYHKNDKDNEDRQRIMKNFG
jgi:hypothetical protein